ncbi:MAG TPA: GYD domain-containing protein [Vicinamibacterales bacterium]|nr:GYD domain-containing protein [Vicinamibacterales bacterium]
MPKYLVRASYTTEGAKGLIKDGGSGRRAAAQKLIESVGGSIESFYYVLGDTDVIIIADLPDATTAAAVSVTVAAGGGVRLSTTPLLTIQEMDAACKKQMAYRAPGA